MIKSFRILVWIILCSCIIALCYQNIRLKRMLNEIERDTVFTYDTVIILDTTEHINPKPQTVLVTDTLYIKVKEKEDKLLKESKMYTDYKNYSVWISGVYPNLDSINVYGNTVYHTITRNVTKTIYDRSWKTYMFVGCNRMSNTLVPSVGLSVTSPKRWIFSAETGFFQDDFLIGLKIGYKINGN